MRTADLQSRKITTIDEKIFFRDNLRASRLQALADAEGFREVLYAIEALGKYLSPRGNGLSDYKLALVNLITESGGHAYSGTYKGELCFADLFERIRLARNDAMHQGVYARHLTASLVTLAVMLEEALMAELNKAGQFMIRTVTCVEKWQPIGLIRSLFLENSFSYIPFRHEDKWKLLSDHSIASYLMEDKNKRKERLNQSLESAIQDGLRSEEAREVAPDVPVKDLINTAHADRRPWLVVDDQNHILGILTSFDLV